MASPDDDLRRLRRRAGRGDDGLHVRVGEELQKVLDALPSSTTSTKPSPTANRWWMPPDALAAGASFAKSSARSVTAWRNVATSPWNFMAMTTLMIWVPP